MSSSRIDLSIYRLKDELFGPFSKSLGNENEAFTMPDRVIDSERNVTALKIDLGNVNAVLVIPGRAPSLPRWAQFLQPVVPNIGAYLSRNSANSAVMLVPIDKRLFAVVFGHGRHIVDAEALIRGFGLRAALSVLDQDMMRHVSYKEVEARTLFGELQSSQATQFHNFSMNPDVQMLRGVAGRCLAVHERWATHAAGFDALRLNPRIDVHDLPKLLRWVTDVDRDQHYKENFAWVDHIRQVTEPAQVEALRSALVRNLKSGGAGVVLGTPEPVDPQASLTYWVGRSASTGVSGPELTNALLRGTVFDSYDALKSRKVFVTNSDGDTVHNWPVWRCLSGEFKHNDERFVVQDGEFFSIDVEFEAKVDKRLLESGAKRALCPAWNTNAHPKEGDYNQKVLLPAVGADAECLDGKCLSPYRGHSQVEVCDVFKRDGQRSILFFVKKYSRSSSPISHLAAQASVSADSLLNDPAFRAEAAGKWPRVAAVLNGPFSPSAMEMRICIAVPKPKKRKTKAAKRKTLADLPFFAKLTLVQRARQIRALGYGLEIELFDYTEA